MKTPLPLLALALAACASAPERPSATHYRLDDYVVYRYTGAFTAQPVTLRETIVDVDGDRITIEVVAERGEATRRWRQVVLDTPSTRSSAQIEALLEWRGGDWVLLANERNQDLSDLFSWTVAPGAGAIRLGAQAKESLRFGGAALDCQVQRGTQRFGDVDAEFQMAVCPDFVWSYGPAKAVDPATDAVLWQVEVTHFGQAWSP